MFRKVKYIYNPSSGEATIGSRLDEIVELYQKNRLSVVPYRLDFGADPEDFLGDVDESYHHLLVAGGDGTVNYVVNRMHELGIDRPIAVLPTGTANDFAALLGMPADPVDACRAILGGEERRIDMGLVNGRLFVNVFSCGLFTDVSQKTPTIMKNTFGKLAYYVNGLGELPKFRRMHLSVRSDGGDYEGPALLFFAFNGRTAGNLHIAYLSEVDDGLLDVLIVKGDRPLEAIRTVIKYLSHRRGLKQYPEGIIHLKCTSLRADSMEEETTDVDGQAGPRFPLEIKCLKGSLSVIGAARVAKKSGRRAVRG